jgi:hypothetical protein
MKPEQQAALREPFPRSAVGKLPKGGQQLDYVGHAAVTDRLLAVDPAWTWEPVALDAMGLPAYDQKGGLWIRLTVGGVTRLGYGDGPDPKQRIGDAIRNAAMRFGVALDLWSKEEVSNTTRPTSPRLVDTETGELPPDPLADAPSPAERVKAGRTLHEPTAPPTEAAFKALQATLAQYAKAEGIDRAEVLRRVSNSVDRAIESTKDLTAAEVSLLLNRMPRKAATA